MSHTKKPTIEKIILALLGLLALAALVRTMFLGLEIDEEYALSLSFRLVRGDRLFYSMWEPHQLAALPPALLIGLFTAVTGINFSDPTEAIPAYIAILAMPFTYSIAEGISFGIITYTVMNALTGNGKKISALMYILTILFIGKYIFL